MRIGLCSPTLYPLSNNLTYGGTERVVIAHALGLADRRHKVHVIAKASSILDHPNITIYPVFGSYKNTNAQVLEQAHALVDDGLIDVLVIEGENAPLINSLAVLPIPLVSILHTHATFALPALNIKRRNHVTYAALTHAHAAHLSEASGLSVPITAIGSGVRTAGIPYSIAPLVESSETPRYPILRLLKQARRNYLVYLGAIGPHKGVATAVQIAQAVGIPLVVLGKPGALLSLGLRDEQAYFRQYIQPHITPVGKSRIPKRGFVLYYIPAVNDYQKFEYLRFAMASIHCSEYENSSSNERFFEAYGLVRAESALCGTPPISFNNGSWLELKQEGITGFGFDTKEQAIEQIRYIHSQGFKRRQCILSACASLSIDKAVSALEHLLAQSLRLDIGGKGGRENRFELQILHRQVPEKR